MMNWGKDGAYIPECTFAWTESEKMKSDSLAKGDAMTPIQLEISGLITTERLTEMKQVCYRCPIRKGCAEFAIDLKPQGLYAGIVLQEYTIRAQVQRADGTFYASGATRARDTALKRLKNLVEFLSEQERVLERRLRHAS